MDYAQSNPPPAAPSPTQRRSYRRQLVIALVASIPTAAATTLGTYWLHRITRVQHVLSYTREPPSTLAPLANAPDSLQLSLDGSPLESASLTQFRFSNRGTHPIQRTAGEPADSNLNPHIVIASAEPVLAYSVESVDMIATLTKQDSPTRLTIFPAAVRPGTTFTVSLITERPLSSDTRISPGGATLDLRNRTPSSARRWLYPLLVTFIVLHAAGTGYVLRRVRPLRHRMQTTENAPTLARRIVPLMQPTLAIAIAADAIMALVVVLRSSS